MTAVVARCSFEAARYAVEHWHYSETLPVGKLVKFGVWEDDRFIGAVLYAWGSNRHLAGQFDLDMVECCELTRVALTEHCSPVTQIVSRSLVELKMSNPGIRLVVSFADPSHGHHGGIYQAGNWIYTGRSSAKIEFIMPDGTMRNRRAYTGQQFGGGRSSMASIPTKARKIRVPGKHRYVYPFDRAMRRQVSKLAQPYPTRGLGLDGETPGSPPGGPGSTPGDRSRSTDRATVTGHEQSADHDPALG